MERFNYPDMLKFNKNGVGGQHIFATMFLTLCCLTAWYMKPKVTWFDHMGSPTYDLLIPHAFGDWDDITEASNNQIVDPQQLYALRNIYTQIVSRTYFNKVTGKKIMLSVAYGDNQTFSKQLHRPESCYSSQGYKIHDFEKVNMRIVNHDVELNRFKGVANQRNEHVNYFIRIGDRIISGPPSNLNVARMLMGINGFIADGLLFRVSEISDDAKESNASQTTFINELMNTISHSDLKLFIGSN